MKKKLRIGIIGCGGIAHGTHIPGYSKIPDDAEVYAICDIRDDRLEWTGNRCNIPEERRFKDYHDLLASGFVDAVDICTPNNVHCEIAHAAINAGLPFSVEKPIGLDFAEADKLCKAVIETNTPSFVCFSWRYNTYARFVRDIIVSGHLGKIYHIFVRCIKDSGLWENRPLEWRFDKNLAGTGVLGDLGSHMIDVIRFWGEEFDGVFAQRGIEIKQRKRVDSDEIAEVTTDDWCNVNAMSKNGVPITITVSRIAKTISELIEFEVIGEKGRIKFTSKAGKFDIEICAGEIDTKANGTHHIVPPASYEGNQSKSFIDMLNGHKDQYTSELVEGMECQKVLEAAVISADEKRYVKIDEIK